MAEVASAACHSEANGRGISPGRQGCCFGRSFALLKMTTSDGFFLA